MDNQIVAPLNQWFEEATVYLSQMEFFAQLETQSKLDVQMLLRKIQGVEFLWKHIESANTSADRDYLLAMFDESRVWGECDYEAVEEDDSYFVETLPAWNKISRGLNPLQSIDVNSDKPDDDSISVSFSIEGKRYGFDYLKSDEDPAQFRALAAINNLIIDTGYQFESFSSGSLDCILIALFSPQEKDALEHDRNWQFFGRLHKSDKGFLSRLD